MSDARISDIDDSKKTMLLELCNTPIGHDRFDLLVTFNSIQFDKFWVKEWATLFSSCSTCASLVKKIEDMQNVKTVDAADATPGSPTHSQRSKKMLDAESVKYVKSQGPIWQTIKL